MGGPGAGSRGGHVDRPIFHEEVASDTKSDAVVNVTNVSPTLLTAGLQGRAYIQFQPKSKTIYYGFDNTVTKNTGIKITSNSLVHLHITEKVEIWAITANGNTDVVVHELKKTPVNF